MPKKEILLQLVQGCNIFQLDWPDHLKAKSHMSQRYQFDKNICQHLEVAEIL